MLKLKKKGGHFDETEPSPLLKKLFAEVYYEEAAMDCLITKRGQDGLMVSLKVPEDDVLGLKRKFPILAISAVY